MSGDDEDVTPRDPMLSSERRRAAPVVLGNVEDEARKMLERLDSAEEIDERVKALHQRIKSLEKDAAFARKVLGAVAAAAGASLIAVVVRIWSAGEASGEFKTRLNVVEQEVLRLRDARGQLFPADHPQSSTKDSP